MKQKQTSNRGDETALSPAAAAASSAVGSSRTTTPTTTAAISSYDTTPGSSISCGKNSNGRKENDAVEEDYEGSEAKDDGAADDAAGAAERSNHADGTSENVAAVAVAEEEVSNKKPAPVPVRNRKSAGTAGALNKTYVQLCHEAIVDLAQGNAGSSLAAIKKWIANRYPDLQGPQFAGRVNGALKTGTMGNHVRFAKVKASFKIAREFKEAVRAKQRKAAAAAAAQKAKSKKQQQQQGGSGGGGEKAVGATTQHLQKKKPDAAAALAEKKKPAETVVPNMSPQAAEALRKQKEEAAQKKAASEARAKHIADRLRRRRFPLEDAKLHEEDKEFGVKPPVDVQPRPYLPYFWHVTLPLLAHPGRSGKTGGGVLAASKVEGLDSDSRGLVPDVLQVYHFFRGDVHFTLDTTTTTGGGGDRSSSSDDENNSIVPAFTLKQFIYCVEQVQNGNARKAKLIPPLLVHVFVTALQILLQPPPPTPAETAAGLLTGNNNSGSKDERQLRKDFGHYLLPALSAASWADVTYLYMDAMERFYTSDASRDPNVLQPLSADVDYLFGRTDEPAVAVLAAVPMTPPPKSVNNAAVAATAFAVQNEQPVVAEQHPLPPGYAGYLGDPRSSLCRAHAKLARQDPWLLTAEELMALLRALTEDILATHPAASQDMAKREDEMFELLKAKRLADLKFRKVRLAFEGPKKPCRPRSKVDDGKNGEESGRTTPAAAEGEPETNGEKAEEKSFKPTATKKQFESAKKAQEKANDAYEKGIRKLVARTEPVGYDRNFNAVYCFLHDPEVLYVEDKKSLSASNTSNLPAEIQFNRYSWHVIETTSLFDQFTASLDIRGRREHDLYEALVGPPGTQQSLRRFLHDDIKEQSDARCKIKEKELLRERLEIARVKCDEEKGRRSGRLAGQAEIELTQIQREIDDLEREATGKKAPAARDYADLTGLVALMKFEMAGRVETRRTREQKGAAQARKLPLMHCSKLCSTGNIDGTGLVGILVSSMLDLEEHCESLAAWDRKDVSRSTWISRLEGAVHAWNGISPDILGSPEPPSRNGLAPSAISSFSMDAGTPAISRQLKRDSIGSDASSLAKRRKLDSPAPTSSSGIAAPTVSSIISILKQPLLDLEERVADITNVALATRDADLADDNMSTDSSGEDQTSRERLEKAWKKIVHKLRQTPAKKHSQIRELLVSAIGAARKAHVPQVVAQLRAALLLYHPNAASDCKVAAIKVLEANGGWDEEDDEESDDEGDGNEDPQEEAAPSVLSAEAAFLRSSLGGSEDASREDWVGLVKSVKTISRLAALAAAFIRDAMEKIEKLEIERDELTSALQAWGKAEERQIKQRDGGKKKTATASSASKEIVGPSEVWASVRYTDEICMAKTEEYPWWPAKKCEAKDPEIARSLSQLNRSLVAFVGEMGGLRVVKTDNLQPFTGKMVDEEAEAEYSKDIRTQLDDCMAMARRIQRGLQLKKKKR